MKIPCKIESTLYEHNCKKYINIQLNEHWYTKIANIHNETFRRTGFAGIYTDSLNHRGQFLKLKVPYRYKKFEVRTHGNKILYDYKYEDVALVEVKYCGFWKMGDYYGNSWKLISISPDIPDTTECHPPC